MKAEEPFECFHWVSPMCFVDNKPLPELCWHRLLRIPLANVDLVVSSGFDPECFFRNETEELFECFHWVSPMCFVDNKPLPDFCWKFPLRILFASLVLVPNGFNTECLFRYGTEERFECSHCVSAMRFVDYTCDKQVLWESAGAFFSARQLSFQTASRIVCICGRGNFWQLAKFQYLSQLLALGIEVN